MCEWATSHFLFFSDNVFDPLIYYSHLAPVVLALVAGAFVFFLNFKELPNRIFVFMMVVFSAWALSDLVLWATKNPNEIMFFWSILIFFDLLLYMAAYYFTITFLQGRDISIPRKVILFLLFLPLVIFVSTPHNLAFFDMTNCDREALEGYLWYYTYVVEMLLVGAILIEGSILTLKKRSEDRWKAFIIVVGSVIFLQLFSWGNISGSLTEDWSVGQYGLFGLPVFVAFLAYAIVKYNALNIRAFGVQILVVAMSIAVATQFFFVKSSLNRVLTAITLFLILTFGFILIRSIRREIQRKEELQMMADRLAQANARLKKLDKAKSDFISIASHQLRTPLTSIKGFISLILEGSYGDVSGDVQSALNKVYLSNERLIHLVEDLLNISRIESGKLQFRIDVCDIKELVRDVSDMFQLRAKDKKLSLVVDIPEGDVPMVMTDEQKVREVLSNIIDNAVKYSDKGEVKVWMDASAKAVRICVKDTGIGIDPDDLPYLFQKFSRGKDIGRVHANGTGLGLYVGKNLIEALNGEITVDSEGQGKGSTFCILLPLTALTGMTESGERQVF